MSKLSAAIVTGASRGIGRSAALALAAAGAPVGLIARDEAKLKSVAEEIASAGGHAAYRAIDITDAEATRIAATALADELEAQGTPVGLLINAAGRIDTEVPLWEADPTQWREIVETNLIGSFNVSRAVIPRMLATIDPASAGDNASDSASDNAGNQTGTQRSARVIELASGAGAKDWAKASAYTSSKAGVIRVAGHLHEAGYALGLRAFAVAPGTVRTDMSTSMQLHKDRTEFTPVELTTNLVLAIHRGELDNWSGKYLRVTHDSPETLAEYEREHGAPVQSARRLAISTWGEDDPQTTEAMVPKK